MLLGPVQSGGREPLRRWGHVRWMPRAGLQGCCCRRAVQFHTPLCVFDIASPEVVQPGRRPRPMAIWGVHLVAAVGSHLGSRGCFFFFFALLEGE